MVFALITIFTISMNLFGIPRAIAGEISYCKPSLTCLQCPNGALCPDKSCALLNPPSWTCNEIRDILLGDLSEWDGVKWVNVSSTVRGAVPLPRQNAAFATNGTVLYLYGGIGSSGGEISARGFDYLVFP